MKKLLIVFLLLIWPCILTADLNPYVAGGGTPAGEPPADDCSGTTLCQNFEGSGYDNSESWSGTSDEDYTTTVLKGDQSLQLANGETLTSPTFSGMDEFWMFFRLKPENTNAFTIDSTLEITDGAERLMGILFNDAEDIRVVHGPLDEFPPNVSTGTISFTGLPTIVVWVHVTKGDGTNNGTYEIWHDTEANACDDSECTRPVSSDASGTNGEWDANQNDLTDMTITWASTNAIILDQFLFSGSEISTVSDDNAE